MKSLGIFLCLSAITAGVLAAEYVVEQKGKAFSSKAVTIKVGDAISFKNADPFNHNVFSLSDAKSFNLASFPQGQSKKVEFDKPGKVEVECAIHPEIKMTVGIKK